MSDPVMSPSPVSKSFVQFGQMILGIAGIFVGVLLGLLMVRAIFFSVTTRIATKAWDVGGIFVFCLLSVFLIWIGTRAVRRSRGRSVPAPRLKWGRLMGGIWLAFFSLKSYFVPQENYLKPNNETEALGMLMSTVVIGGAGLLMILFALKPILRQKSEKNSASPS